MSLIDHKIARCENEIQSCMNIINGEGTVSKEAKTAARKRSYAFIDFLVTLRELKAANYE